MSDTAILAENLAKRYCIGGQRQMYSTLRETLVSAAKNLVPRGAARSRSALIWALKDVSFEVKHGEVVGIIGRNGAGKSTLLKVLAHITEPTEGRVSLRGRVGSLLEVGTGFHPELTGRDNIYLNGAILGMRRAEIEQKFDEIVEFAEIGKFLNTPVKRYSSGMYVRLAFAIAAHLEPEILLVDEVLAVGDAQFQNKCLGKMGDVAKQGRTVLFVSHNLGAVSGLCSTTMYMDRGQIRRFASTAESVSQYLAESGSGSCQIVGERTDRNPDGTGSVRIRSIRFFSPFTHEPLETLISGQDISIQISYESKDHLQIRDFNIGLAFYNGVGQFITVLNSQMAAKAFRDLPPDGSVYCNIHRFPLMGGTFHITCTLHINGQLADQVENACRINVETGDFYRTGIPNANGRQGIFVPQEWSQSFPATTSGAIHEV